MLHLHLPNKSKFQSLFELSEIIDTERKHIIQRVSAPGAIPAKNAHLFFCAFVVT